MKPRTRSTEPKARRGFDVERYLESAGPARKVEKYRRGDVVFSQGDPSDDVRYLQKGAIKLSVLSRIGKEAIVAMLAPGDFFGEGALAGQSIRIGTATAVVPSSVLIIEKEAMIRLLRNESAFSDRFISYMLTRNMRIEADLIEARKNVAGTTARARVDGEARRERQRTLFEPLDAEQLVAKRLF